MIIEIMPARVELVESKYDLSRDRLTFSQNAL